ncbi:MAG: PhzF family phenazine biosynthesis protein [Alphaproteobacteria bacterium]|nr:PhzF family phenazine biosynthesis protein [Alphaproteobacteria bacterium]MCB9928088.1 PhzF family phenazine biosynthesis protein [Alphaproteobacteria bacterium]
MRFSYLTLDVFTERRFGGNQLAVLPDARGLSTEQMQAIAREFNYSETTFVLPASAAENDARVRIFTPAREVPFAGHPNVGTAHALALLGRVQGRPVGDVLRFEEEAGLVTLSIARDGMGAPLATEFTAPAALELGESVPLAHVAAASGLPADAFSTSRHTPQTASVGLPFTLAEVRDLAALAAVKPDLAAFETHFAGRSGDALYLYVRTGAHQVQARMLAPLHGVIEDPATGSAAAALTGFLAHLDAKSDGTVPLTIAQGLEMGRPSLIQGAADKSGNQVAAVRVGGPSVAAMEGFLTV